VGSLWLNLIGFFGRTAQIKAMLSGSYLPACREEQTDYRPSQ
jgi:hypothetical protein